MAEFFAKGEQSKFTKMSKQFAQEQAPTMHPPPLSADASGAAPQQNPHFAPGFRPTTGSLSQRRPPAGTLRRTNGGSSLPPPCR